MQKLLNKITYYFLQRAYAQLEAAGDLQNEDDVAEFLEDYYAQKVIQGLTTALVVLYQQHKLTIAKRANYAKY